jgi:glycosyltransferase involved in cell wall biosynthesis
VRILHVIHDFLPRHQAGSEIYAFELCRALSSRHHVSVLCAERDPSRDHGHVTWRVHDGLAVVEITNNWRCSSFEDTYRSPKITDQIAHVLRAIDPDVIHLHSLLNLSFDLTALAKARRIPIIATLHDYSLVCPSGGQRIHRDDDHICQVIDSDRCARCFRQSDDFAWMAFGRLTSVTHASPALRRPAVAMAKRFPMLLRGVVNVLGQSAPSFAEAADIERRLEVARQVFRDVDLFIAPSAFIAGEFERLGVPAAKMQVADYGVAPFTPRRRAARTGPLRIGYVGTLVWHKGVHVLAEALRGMPAGSCEARIFGGLDVSPEYVAQLRSRIAGQPVRLMGPFDRTDLAGVYDQIDVLVVPSLWLENSPLVIHEAFMAGVPVVGARIGGICGLIDDGENGVLYEATSSDALCEALRRIAGDPDVLAHLRSGAAATRVKSIADDARSCEVMYDGLARERSGGRSA